MSQSLVIPTTLAEVLSPEWLTDALGRRYPGVTVVNTIPGPVEARISTNARFEIEVEGSLPEGLPRHLCAKGYFDLGQPVHRAGEWEALFYRDISGTLKARVPRCVYAEVDPSSGTAALITEDVVAKGGRFLDPRHPCSAEMVSANLEQYALFHGQTWDSSMIGGLPWLTPRLASSLAARGVDDLRYNFDGPIGEGVPRGVRQPERLVDCLKALDGMAHASGSWCLVHCDAHMGNIFLGSDGVPGIADWQTVQRGLWFLDVGYQIGTALSIDDRRTFETELLGGYLDKLEEAGGPRLDREVAWTGYLQGLVYGFWMWGITRFVKPEITSLHLARLGAAVEDHRAMDALVI